MKRKILFLLILLIAAVILLFYFCRSDDCTLAASEAENTYSIVKSGSQIGRFTKYDYLPGYDKESLQDIQAKRIQPLLQELGVFAFFPPETSYAMSTSKYADWQLTQYMVDHEETTYFYLFDSHMYALWLDPAAVGSAPPEELLMEITENLVPQLP